jgi:hypothetical protein
MSSRCGSTIQGLADYLGFSCQHANPVVTFRDPFHLANWTLPILELTIIAGAIFALVHALRRRRLHGDPTNLALWWASLVYLFVVEPPLYFPEWFGLQKSAGVVFVHNVFTVQFMFDRLPLYIVAIYPALSALAYEIVRSLGIFERRGPLVGAVCVALVYQAFYEVFDQLGPQLKWWAWNLDNVSNHPLFASVPMNSMVLFASVSSGFLTYLVARTVGRPTLEGAPPRGRSLFWRVVVSGALVPLAMIIAGLPTSIFGRTHPNLTGQAIMLSVELGLLWIGGSWVLFQEWRTERRTRTAAEANQFVRTYPIAYLVVLGALWASALPAFFDATDGITKKGTPIGNGPYTLLCFAFAATCIVAVRGVRAETRAETPSEVSVG